MAWRVAYVRGKEAAARQTMADRPPHADRAGASSARVLARQELNLLRAGARCMRIGPFSCIGAKHYSYLHFQATDGAGKGVSGNATAPGCINGPRSKNVDVRFGG